MQGVIVRVKQGVESFRSRVGMWRGDLADTRSGVRLLAWTGLIYLVCVVVLGFYWSSEPEAFDIDARVKQEVPDYNGKVVGTYTTSTLIGVASTLYDKKGGYLTNDLLPPGLLLDNIPNWEYGVLIQVRDFNKAMREAFSRSQTQSTEDKNLALAESRFNFDNNSWILPKTESEYREGVDYLRRYLLALQDEEQSKAQFYARADNLSYWLATVETRLGSISQRLTASVGQRRLNTDLANEIGASQSTPTGKEVEIKTPWLELDDVFYEARGTAWALIHLLKAVEKDFDPILGNKNAKVSLEQIIRELEQTQETVFSPTILNGSGFGMLANHSLVMASYLSRANAALIDLRELLAKG